MTSSQAVTTAGWAAAPGSSPSARRAGRRFGAAQRAVRHVRRCGQPTGTVLGLTRPLSTGGEGRFRRFPCFAMADDAPEARRREINDALKPIARHGQVFKDAAAVRTTRGAVPRSSWPASLTAVAAACASRARSQPGGGQGPGGHGGRRQAAGGPGRHCRGRSGCPEARRARQHNSRGAAGASGSRERGAGLLASVRVGARARARQAARSVRGHSLLCRVDV